MAPLRFRAEAGDLRRRHRAYDARPIVRGRDRVPPRCRRESRPGRPPARAIRRHERTENVARRRHQAISHPPRRLPTRALDRIASPHPPRPDQRGLGIGSHPLIPRGLFAMLQASEPASSPLAGITRAADEALMEVQGFPLADHAELPYENKKMVVDHTVTKIEQRDVPATLLAVNKTYSAAKPASVPSTTSK